MTPSAAAIIPAAGNGTRMGLNRPKQYLLLAGLPILVHTVRAFLGLPFIKQIVVVAAPDQQATTRDLLAAHGLEGSGICVVAGGSRRQDSVLAGLNEVMEDVEVVLVHDGARPLVSKDLITRCYQEAQKHGAAIAAVPVKDTLKRDNGDRQVLATIDRQALWQAQTPQAARRTDLAAAFARAKETEVTDEAMLLELNGYPVQLVTGEETNIKITRMADLTLAEHILRPVAPTVRIGHGFDAHRLTEGRKLVLGGITIPFHLGLAGHSDADVVTHALCDALLGAAALGDIGQHFPDSDENYKDIFSIKLLQDVVARLHERGLVIGNIDLTIICQAPRLAPHLAAMRERLASACGISVDMLNIKATTTETMGYTGRGEGISCHAIALVNN